MPDASLAADVALIKHARVYFGHHSVGNNVLRGVYELSAGPAGAEGITFHPLSDTTSLPDSFFADALIGENTRPDTKCDAFLRSFDYFKGHMPDIAFMKFCFVDFGQGMSADAIFARYRSTMDALRKRHPSTAFVHVTAPLTSRPTGLKEFVKKLLGRGANFEADNMERNRFNRLLREHYAGEPLFDLALIEATRPDGTRERFTVDGAEYDALAPAYTDDGGHLNDAGQKRAGRELIRVLAETLRRR